MTATDTIRAMLDERGVEHWDTVGITEFRGENDRTVRCYARPEPMTLDVAIVAAPPEQAIEATLGRGECRNESIYTNVFLCSECGWEYDFITTPRQAPRYCPHCGARVIGGEA